MKIHKKIAINILALVCLVITSPLKATQYHPATITHITVGGPLEGDVVIRLDGHDRADKPSCASGFWTMRFDGTTEKGKQTYALALLAWSTGSSLTVKGEGYCKAGTTTEELRWMRGR